MGEKLTKNELSWCFYDWANSVYATIIMAAIFPIYFTTAAEAAGVSGDVVWGYGTSISTAIIAVSAPILGSIADFRGMKKRLISIFVIIGCVFTISMALFDNWQMMLLGYIISYVGFAGSCLFYDSFLTDVTTPERMDIVSAKGYAFGYIGGSTIGFFIGVALVMFAPQLHISNSTAVKICVILTAVWWAVFSIPLLKNVRQIHYIERPESGIARAALRNIWHTAQDILGNRGLLLFTIAYFFYIDGVGTVIHMATSYGTSLGLGSTGMILALAVTQIVAVPCSIAFARIAKRIGARAMLMIGISIYVVVCVLGFYMGFSLENAQLAAQAVLDGGGTQAAYDAIYEPALHLSQTLFWVLAALVGTSQGGMQALSRSQFGKMIPPARSNEFFGFFDIFGKFATIIGPLLYAICANSTGRSSIGILGLLILFAIGLIILWRTPKEAFTVDRSAADNN
ncbi:MAG: MFS transporter [Bacillota bacterium]|nr:MFS transporter [Bacillota bacterium]